MPDIAVVEDLLQLTSALMAIPSVSFDEAALTDAIELELRAQDHLEVTRVGDNLVARTMLGRDVRVVLAGHTDTVPPNDNAAPEMDGDTLRGVGSADMKGGLAIMLALAARHVEPAVDVSYVFYAREEVAAIHSGLGELFESRADLLEGDLAILGEPTDGQIEAGCQGTLRFTVTLAGSRAHVARAWKGRNAIHRLGSLLAEIDRYEPRRPQIQGCQFHEALQVVRVDGGIAGNVVPDRVEFDLVHRFAPDRDSEQGESHVRELLAPWIEEGDEVLLVDHSPAASPVVDHRCVVAMVERHGLAVRGKLGWTDVARFAAEGIAAVNFGPGDSSLAHAKDEHLRRESIERTERVLDDLLSNGI